MPKITAPMFGLGASGQIGKAIVYFPWKGLDLARQYVKPANPNTAAQSTQRGYMTSAVAEWHDATAARLQSQDIEAWNRYATLLGPMSGFNAFCRSFINERVLGGTVPGHFWGESVSDPTHNSVDVEVSGDGLTTEVVTMNWGATATSQPYNTTQAAVAGTATFAAIDTGFAAGEKIYVWFSVGTVGTDYMRSGLYTITLT